MYFVTRADTNQSMSSRHRLLIDVLFLTGIVAWAISFLYAAVYYVLDGGGTALVCAVGLLWVGAMARESMAMFIDPPPPPPSNAAAAH
jgi:hypothetical protein